MCLSLPAIVEVEAITGECGDERALMSVGFSSKPVLTYTPQPQLCKHLLFPSLPFARTCCSCSKTFIQGQTHVTHVYNVMYGVDILHKII